MNPEYRKTKASPVTFKPNHKQFSQKTLKNIATTICNHGYAILKNQNLSPDGLLNVAKQFGEVVTFDPTLSFANQSSDKKILTISNVASDGKLIKNFKGADRWHTDNDFYPSPRNHAWTFLYCKTAQKAAGTTMFADCYNPAEKFSAEMLDHFNNLKIVVDPNQLPDFEEVSELPIVTHHLIQTHPISNKPFLYVSGPEDFIQIEGKNRQESHMLVKRIHDVLTQEHNVYTHHWEDGDLLIWDNLTSLHKAGAIDPNQPRILYRAQAIVDTNSINNLLC